LNPPAINPWKAGGTTKLKVNIVRSWQNSEIKKKNWKASSRSGQLRQRKSGDKQSAIKARALTTKYEQLKSSYEQLNANHVSFDHLNHDIKELLRTVKAQNKTAVQAHPTHDDITERFFETQTSELHNFYFQVEDRIEKLEANLIDIFEALSLLMQDQERQVNLNNIHRTGWHTHSGWCRRARHAWTRRSLGTGRTSRAWGERSLCSGRKSRKWEQTSIHS
jgi:outer membrane murein-binding lipoprotein Lpp